MIGVSARGEYRENGFGGLSKTKYDRTVVHTKEKYQSSETVQLIYIGG